MLFGGHWPSVWARVPLQPRATARHTHATQVDEETARPEGGTTPLVAFHAHRDERSTRRFGEPENGRMYRARRSAHSKDLTTKKELASVVQQALLGLPSLE